MIDHPRERGMCLLVLKNEALADAWLSMLNNDELDKEEFGEQGAIDEVDPDDADRCWKRGKGLSVLNLIGAGKAPPVASRMYQYDVVMVTSYCMAKQSTWVTDHKWTTVIADEAHDFLRGQSSKSDSEQSLTLSHWWVLLTKTHSAFLMTGTPFSTNISHDAKKAVQAIACNDVRARWGPDYTDAGLDKLLEGWVQNLQSKSDDIKAKQQQRTHRFAEILAPIMIRRDHGSIIRGEPVSIDWDARCLKFITSLESRPAEVAEREAIIRRMTPHRSNNLSTRATDFHRMLSYSHRFEHYRGNKGKAAFWEDYDLSEAKHHVRTTELIRILKKGKTGGNGIIVFCDRVFLAELSMKVLLLLATDIRYVNSSN